MKSPFPGQEITACPGQGVRYGNSKHRGTLFTSGTKEDIEFDPNRCLCSVIPVCELIVPAGSFPRGFLP